MSTLFIALGSLVLYLVAYHTYGRWLSRKIFKLDAKAPVPSVALRDDEDFVPTSKGVIFGHHFTSIAGTGPIVGPAIAVLWGWLPALLWVLIGSILIGAVHDLGALVVSMRNRGQTVGEIAGRLISPRMRTLFLTILFLALTLVLAVFGLVIAKVFVAYPTSIFPCLIQIPLAIVIGAWLHRRGVNLVIPSILALGLMYLSVVYGDVGALHAINTFLAAQPIMTWVLFLLVYSYVASVLPVWLLLQPRDFINSLQLLSALGLVVIGLAVAAFIGGAPDPAGVRPTLELVAPASHLNAAGGLPVFPFLFITIACGAISGFHCLVSSGTSSKQLKCETDAQFVGYGSMLTEGFLAVMVILACTAGIGLGFAGKGGALLTGASAWQEAYANGFASNPIRAFVEGAANFVTALGLSKGFAIALMGVLVASFAATTMDTACRLQRYIIQELSGALRENFSRKGQPGLPFLSVFQNKHGATLLAIVLSGLIAAFPKAGEAWSYTTAGSGGLILWPVFGAINQLLGGLAFIVIAFWMWRRGIPIWFIAIPACLLILVPGYAMVYQLFIAADGKGQSWIEQKNWLLVGFGISTLILQVAMVIEALRLFPKARGVLEANPAVLPPVN
ncbi:MAG: carbon starvation protein A [Verrucomicrobiales bacterium]|nr:carbon starvation protein A [Verrucomicrobiales bacterium]